MLASGTGTCDTGANKCTMQMMTLQSVRGSPASCTAKLQCASVNDGSQQVHTLLLHSKRTASNAYPIATLQPLSFIRKAQDCSTITMVQVQRQSDKNDELCGNQCALPDTLVAMVSDNILNRQWAQFDECTLRRQEPSLYTSSSKATRKGEGTRIAYVAMGPGTSTPSANPRPYLGSSLSALCWPVGTKQTRISTQTPKVSSPHRQAAGHSRGPITSKQRGKQMTVKIYVSFPLITSMPGALPRLCSLQILL